MSSHIVWITWTEHTLINGHTVTTDKAHPIHCERHHQAVDTATQIARDPRTAMTQRGLPATTAHHPQADMQPVPGCSACNRTRSAHHTPIPPTNGN